MLHGLSRTALNVIIIVCLLAISWIHLSQDDVEEEPLEPLVLPTLNAADWNIWSNNEGIYVALRAGGNTDGGRLKIHSAQQSVDLPLPFNDWSAALQSALANIEKQQSLVIVISGPWSSTEQQAIAALTIRELQPTPRNESRLHWSDCIRQHSAGALWLADQLQLPWYQLAQLTQAATSDIQPPLRDDWATWRLQKSRELRRQWQDEQGLIDIQAVLAYHRLPDSAYPMLYQSLADAQKTEVSEALSCLQPVQGSPNE